MNREIPLGYIDAAPEVPSADALDRVCAAAKGRASNKQTYRTSRPLRLAAYFAVAAATIAVFLWQFAPRVDDSAFARQQAVAALLPHDGVLHVKTIMQLDPKQTSVGESWIDASTGSSRDTFKAQGDSGIGELTIRRGAVVRSLGRDGGVNGKYRVVQYDAPDELTSPGGGYVDILRENLNSGKARVIDRLRQSDGEYWVVESSFSASDKVTGDSTERVRATMRVGDYRLKELSIHRVGKHPVDGEWTENILLRFETWEKLTRDSLPSSFFDLGEVDRTAPKGAIIEVPLKEE